MSEFSWDNKFVGAQTLLAKVHMRTLQLYNSLFSSNSRRERKLIIWILLQDYHAGNTNLLKYKTNAESFICAVMPGSSSVQVQRTPGILTYYIINYK